MAFLERWQCNECGRQRGYGTAGMRDSDSLTDARIGCNGCFAVTLHTFIPDQPIDHHWREYRPDFGESEHSKVFGKRSNIVRS